ncbi:MAG TPA: hypothetical protein VNA17_08145 [Pyrinomonadaceae bacterium]|nr:hypothetical protein [Pyrinomonadaceae bacterium]
MKGFLTGLFFVLVFGASTARAQCREAGSINVARGQTSATVKGRITSARAVCYKFRARAGQTMSATLTSSNRQARFSIQPDAFDVDDAVTGDTTSWSGKLKGDYGNDYIVSIQMLKGSGTYALKVTFR